MESKHANQEPSDAEAGTLGAVLYADKAASPSEKDWVAIVRSIAAGDQSALHALYERAHQMVFTVSLRITKSRETAEEVTLDVFHDVWRRASSYDPAGGTVIGWFMNQARSRAIDRVRFEQRKKRVDPGTAEAGPAPAQAGPGEAFDRGERAQRLRGALDVLNPHERQAIESAFFSGLTYVEVAERLDVPLGTVKTRVRSGLGKLRRELGEGEKEP